ncbi:MAG: hypothetical protein ACJ75J_15970 [Cytophagaceae bacterium]
MRYFLNQGIIPLLFLILLTSTSYSQRSIYNLQRLYGRPAEDSLKSFRAKLYVLESKKGNRNDDSLRLELINKIAALYTKKYKDTALYYAQTALTEAKSLKFKNLTAVSLYNMASIYELYKDMAMAEKNYLEWMDVRKNQSDDEYRWALNELRRFYCLTRQEEKLQKNEAEWLAVLDRQLDQGHISPWYKEDDGAPDGTPRENYEISISSNLSEIIGCRCYFVAENSFLHMIRKCPDCDSTWETAHRMYGYAALTMLQWKDTARLALWYEHWYDALEKYGPGKERSLETFNDIAQEYTSGYFKYDRYFDKFYPLMMRYTEKVGGDPAVHDMLLASSRRYVSSLTVKIKLNLLLIGSSVKVKDKATMEKAYSQADKCINEYLAKEYFKPDLSKVLLAAKSQSTDKRFKKWCSKKIKMLD